MRVVTRNVMKNDKQKKVMRGEGAEGREGERAWKMSFVILLKRKRKKTKRKGEV